MRLSVTKSKEALKESGGASFIGSSGVYPITINFASLAVSSGGAESVNFNITYNDKTQTLWGPYVTDKEGNDLDIGNNLITKLGVIAGMEDGDSFTIEEESHEVGKDNKEQDFDVIQEFSDLDCMVHVQEEYSRYNGDIKDKLVIKGFFDAEGASAEELVEGGEVGKRLELVQEKYANNITYRDDVTPEEVQEWKDNGRGKSSGGSKAKVNTSKGRKTFGRKK